MKKEDEIRLFGTEKENEEYVKQNYGPPLKEPEMIEIEEGDPVVYQKPRVKKEGAIDSIEIVLLKVTEVKDETFTSDNLEGDLPKYRVKHIAGDKMEPYEGYNYHKIAVEEGNLSLEDYETLKEMGRIE